MLQIRAVKMDYSTDFGPAHSGFELSRVGLKCPDKIRAAKTVAKPGPVWAFGLAHFIYLFIFLKKLLVLN
jgi:hypothetical protein